MHFPEHFRRCLPAGGRRTSRRDGGAPFNSASCPRFPNGYNQLMSGIKIVAIILIVLGILGLVYGKFSYTKDTHEAKLGPLELEVKEKETVNVPMWAGVGAIVLGVVLLVIPRKR